MTKIERLSARVVDLLAGDQHDEGEIDRAFSIKGLGDLVNEIRDELARLHPPQED
jgi:hypothetical protein